MEARFAASDQAKMPMPATLSTRPTQPVDVQPSPAAMATPPSQAPSALATLKAEWLSAAARVWASPATSIRRICSAGPMATMVPSRKVASAAVATWWAAKTKNTSTAADHASSPPMVRMSALSAMREPARLPATMPRPKSASTKGTPDSGRPATSISVGLM